MNNIEKLIKDNLPKIKYSTNIDDFEKYGKDRTNFYKVNPAIILFPKSTKEVRLIVELANLHNLKIVPSGGRTGLSGGAVAKHNEVVVSLDYMNKVLDFNEINQTLSVEAGVITEEIQEIAREKGLYYPVDFGSRGSSHIGGNIATNAGGIRVLRYGLTRNQIVGLTMVTGSGKVIKTNNGLLKNATGYDLRHLIIGSEGTLGIITEAIIKLINPPGKTEMLLFGIKDIGKSIPILTLFKRQVCVSAFEFVSHKALLHSTKLTKKPLPFNKEYPFYILIEFENNSESTTDKVESVVSKLYEDNIILSDIYGTSTSEIELIWSYREQVAEALAPFTPYKNDISVLTSKIPKFIEEAEKLLKKSYPNFEIIWYGHIADGNLHINILKPDTMPVDDFHKKCDQVSLILFSLIKKHKGKYICRTRIGFA